MAKMLMVLTLVQAAPDEGLTFGELLAAIPHDAAAIVIYLLVGVSVGLVFWSGRRGGPKATS